MKYTFFISTFLVLLLMNSACELFKRTPRGNNNGLEVIKANTSNKDSVATKKDTLKAVITKPLPTKVDTIVWTDTLQENAYKKLVMRYTKIGTNPVIKDTLAVIDLSGKVDNSKKNKQTRIARVKPSYNVAIILPFMTNLSSGRSEIPVQSTKAIEFYEGIKMALDSLNKEGLRLQISVFDSKKEEADLDAVLSKMEGTEWDLIIGPTSTDLLQKLAEYGKKHQIPVISAFNDNPNAAEDNHFYLQVNPSFEVHSRYIAEFLNEHVKVPAGTGLRKINYLLLGMAEDSTRMRQIQEAYSLAKNNPTAKLPELIANESIGIASLQKYFSRDGLNVVIIPSDKSETFVFSCLREISSLYNKLEARSSYQFLVLGTAQWKYFERINYEYYNNLNLHITDEFFVDKTERRNQQFEEAYRQVYGIAPREFAYIGFDVMLYFGRMLKKHGTAFPDFLDKEPANGRHTGFFLEPVMRSRKIMDKGTVVDDTVISRFENQFINLLKFDAYEFKRVNMGLVKPE